jgi:hypothetical protein
MSNTHTDSTPAPAPVGSNIENPIVGSTEDQIKQSVRALNEQRSRDGTLVEESAPDRLRYLNTGKDVEPETYKEAEPKKLRQVAKDVSNYHKKNNRDFQSGVRVSGRSPEEFLEATKDVELIKANLGLSHQEAVEVSRTLQPPPTKIGSIKVDGYGRKIHSEPLGDHAVEDVLDEPLTVREATKRAHNFRTELAAQQDALRQEIEGAQERVAAQQESEHVDAEQRVAQAQHDQQQAEAQRQQAAAQQQQQQAEKARIAHLEWQARASNEERALVDHWQKWEQWARATPEMLSNDALRHTQQTNPARFAELQKAYAQAQQTRLAIQARLQELGHTRNLKQFAAGQIQQQQQAAQYREYSKAEDAKALDLITREIPAYKTEEGRRAISQQSRAMLKNLGLTDAHIKQVWTDGAPINLRSAPAQAVIAKAAAYDLAVERARQANKVPIPPVQSPGMHRPHDGLEKVRATQAELSSARGQNQSLKAATKYLQAQRAARKAGIL